MPKTKRHTIESKPVNEVDRGTIFDESNPDSLLNRLDGALLNIVKNLPKEYLLELEDLKKTYKYAPRKEINLVRHAFWFEYDRALKAGIDVKMNAAAISRGVYLDETRFVAALADPCNVAYMLIPVSSYKVVTEGMHAFALDQMFQILNMPNMLGNKPNVALINQKLKIWEKLDMRIKGGFIQKQQIHAITEHVGMKEVAQAQPQLPAPNIDEEIAKLQEQLKPKALIKMREVSGDE